MFFLFPYPSCPILSFLTCQKALCYKCLGRGNFLVSSSARYLVKSVSTMMRSCSFMAAHRLCYHVMSYRCLCCVTCPTSSVLMHVLLTGRRSARASEDLLLQYLMRAMLYILRVLTVDKVNTWNRRFLHDISAPPRAALNRARSQYVLRFVQCPCP